MPGTITSALTSSTDDTSVGSSGVMCFSEHTDRLACDPANCTWVYGVYTYKYDVTEAQAQSHVRGLVDRMMARAARHYAESVLVYRRLSESERRTQILRGVSPVSRPVELPFLLAPRMHASPNASARRASVSVEGPDAAGLALPSPRGSPSASLSGSARRRGSLSVIRAARAAQTLNQDDAMAVLARRWPSLPVSPEEQVRLWLAQSDAPVTGASVSRSAEGDRRPGSHAVGVGRAESRVYSIASIGETAGSDGLARAEAVLGGAVPSVRIVIDLIASRKSLGAAADITLSAPYVLGQYIYTYVQSRFSPAGGRHATRASPSSNTEAALATDRTDWLSDDVETVAEVVQRYSTVTITTVAISDASNKLAGRDVLFPCRTTAASSAAAVVRNHGASILSAPDATMTAAAIDQLLSTSPAMALLFPSVGGARLPPVQKELLDQSRMVICFPRMASLTV